MDVKIDLMPLTNDQDQVVGCLLTLHDLTLARQLDQVISDQVSLNDIVGKDPAMMRIFETVRQVAPSDATVLIEGATGTGKNKLAGVIHSASRRSDRQLVKVNCAALPDNLLESEMFGYVKGAFTGAERNKPGRFQEANGGTILLDEIGDLPLPLQAKLLRVLEDQEFYPLGGRHNGQGGRCESSPPPIATWKISSRNACSGRTCFIVSTSAASRSPPLKDRPSGPAPLDPLYPSPFLRVPGKTPAGVDRGGHEGPALLRLPR